MSLRGSLGTMSAEDALEWVAKRKVSAPITFERRGLVRSLVVEDGEIVWASSNRRDEQLGVILVRSGLVAERALADSLEARAETGVPLGKVLLMSGLITEADLVDILATKIRETVTDVITWNDGQFDIVPRTQPATGVIAQLGIEVCLTVARRRAARMTEIMGILGADDVTFYVPETAAPPAQLAEDRVDAPKAWALAGDRHTAAEIAASFSGERYATYDKLAQMVTTGILVIDRRQRERTNSAVELAAGARGRLRHGDRAGAFAMASQALHQDPSDPEVRKTFAQIERARVAEVAKRLLSQHRVPKRVKDPSRSLGLTDTEIELANRVDGRWDLLSLVRSANVREAEALLAFARLAELGVVELGGST
ncbi:MAG TPA: DUF4388 domain-containing protein [Kofleriaceae bacterium]|nr:DUF4388 domain-containing protein [Kofleriaceae bacterium]